MFLRISAYSILLLAVASAQSASAQQRLEFEVASIRSNPPTNFHFGADSGKADFSSPEMFRCSKCTLATLIATAFNLQSYQIPGRASLGNNTFEVAAKIPDGATAQQVPAMLQSLLKERFGLTYHFVDKPMKGYLLTVAKSGSKLKESEGAARPHASTGGQGHSHEGLVSFRGSSSFRGGQKTMADLRQIISDHLGLPVDDQTNLNGKYDITLSWSGSAAPSAGGHGEGGWSGGGAGHGDHSSAGPLASRDDAGGPTLFDALQSQLGLKLVPTERAAARILIVDHATQQPTAN